MDTVEIRTLVLHDTQDQISRLPTEIRNQLSATGKIEGRLRRLEDVDTTVVSTHAGGYQLSSLLPLGGRDPAARREVRRLEG